MKGEAEGLRGTVSVQNLGAAQDLRVRNGGVREGDRTSFGVPVSSGAGACLSPVLEGRGLPEGRPGFQGRREGEDFLGDFLEQFWVNH